jgi:predicted LPLAT superfamily acyltransferase
MKFGGRARGYHLANFASLWYVLYPSVRRRCRFYLDRRFPERRGALQRLADDFRLLRTYSHSLVDMMVLGMFGRSAMTADSPDHDRLRALAAQPGGLIVLHAHVGCWQVGMSTLGEFERPVSVVMIPEPRTTALFPPGVRVIDPRTGLGGVMEMTQALLRGEIVSLMGDRSFGDEQNTAPVRLLGGEARFPITPYRLASATGAKVLVLTAPKLARGRYALRLSRVIEVPPGLGRSAAAYAPYAQQFADVIEQFAVDFPWQFNNFYDLWQPKSIR